MSGNEDDFNTRRSLSHTCAACSVTEGVEINGAAGRLSVCGAHYWFPSSGELSVLEYSLSGCKSKFLNNWKDPTIITTAVICCQVHSCTLFSNMMN